MGRVNKNKNKSKIFNEREKSSHYDRRAQNYQNERDYFDRE